MASAKELAPRRAIRKMTGSKRIGENTCENLRCEESAYGPLLFADDGRKNRELSLSFGESLMKFKSMKDP
jgi:hypothetical protein